MGQVPWAWGFRKKSCHSGGGEGENKSKWTRKRRRWIKQTKKEREREEERREVGEGRERMVSGYNKLGNPVL